MTTLLLQAAICVYITFSAILVYHLHIALAEVARSDILSSSVHLKPEWRAFIRPPSSSLPRFLYVTVVFLGPLRLFTLVFILVCATLASFINPAWTQRVYRTLGPIFHGVQRLRLRVHGVEDARAAAFAANHSSGLDEHLGWLMQSEISWVAKSEVRTIPCLGQMCAAVNSVFVDRKSEIGRQVASEEIGNFFEKFPTRKLFIFPEGTCTNGSALLPFKQTVFSYDRWIQPVCIKYSNCHTSFPIDERLLVHLALVFALPEISCDVTLLPAVKTASDARLAISECGNFQLGSGSQRACRELRAVLRDF